MFGKEVYSLLLSLSLILLSPSLSPLVSISLETLAFAFAPVCLHVLSTGEMGVGHVHRTRVLLPWRGNNTVSEPHATALSLSSLSPPPFSYSRLRTIPMREEAV